MGDLASSPDYYDSDGTRLGVEPPTSSRPSIRVLARSDALACRVDLTASGADYLGRLLVSTAAAVVAALDQDEQDEDAGPATPGCGEVRADEERDPESPYRPPGEWPGAV